MARCSAHTISDQGAANGNDEETPPRTTCVEPSDVSTGDTKQCGHCGNSQAAPQIAKHRITILPRNSTPKNKPKTRHSGLCSLIHKSQGYKQARCPSPWMEKQNGHAHTTERYSGVKRQAAPTHAPTQATPGGHDVEPCHAPGIQVSPAILSLLLGSHVVRNRGLAF